MNTLEKRPFHTSLAAIRTHSPCEDGWRKLLSYLGKTHADDAPLSLLTVLESNGLNDALWCLRAVDGYDREMRLYAVWGARQVQHLMADPRSIKALDVAEAFAYGRAPKKKLGAVWDAWAAAGAAAGAARAAAWATAGAAEDAWAAAGAAARAAAWATAGAAEDAWAAAGAAAGAAEDAWAAARGAARAIQKTKFIEMIEALEAGKEWNP